MKTLDNSMPILRFKSKTRMKVLVAERGKIRTSKRICGIAWTGLGVFTAFLLVNLLAGAIFIATALDSFTSIVTLVSFIIVYLATVPAALYTVATDCWNNRHGEHSPRWYRSVSKTLLIMALAQTVVFAGHIITGNYGWFIWLIATDPFIIGIAYLTSFKAERLAVLSTPTTLWNLKM